MSIPYNPSLDGLRAIGIAGVLLSHGGVRNNGGFHGVTMFFVISGYLITHLLLAERSSAGRVDFRAFYWRRFARLAPAAFVLVGATVVWLAFVGGLRSHLLGVLGTLTYSTNFLLQFHGPSGIGHLFTWSWSLAIEEQYYLVWPVLLIAVMTRARRPKVNLAIGLSVLVVADWIWRAIVMNGSPTHERVFYALDMHLDALAIGGLVALVVVSRFTARPDAERWARLAGLAGGLVFAAYLIKPGIANRYLPSDAGGFGEVALACGVMVLGLVVAPRSGLARVLSNAPMLLLGRMSYSLYLWNLLTIIAFTHWTGQEPAHSWWGLLWLAAVLGIGYASFTFVEKPLRRRIVRMTTKRPVARVPVAA